MLIATQGQSVIATQQYFEQVLSQGDYYLGQEVSGQWHGRGASILGLGAGSDVARDQFKNLLNGLHPADGTPLAQRQRTDRRPGVDLTFSVPKSVSLVWAINRDVRVIELLREVVQETMTKDVEPLMQRRVREGEHAWSKQRTETGKLIYADFLHKTSRPVEGKPDPHLHIHAFVINWTEHNGKHYAGEFEEIIRQRPSLQAKFEARLAEKLQSKFGYEITATKYQQSGRLKSGWEIKGITRKTIEKFSQRTEQVEQYAQEHGITDEFAKSQLGKLTREKKDTGKSIDELRTEWLSRLSETERSEFAQLQAKPQFRTLEQEQQQAKEALKYALDHHLYRQSTVEKHQVIGTALEKAVTISPEKMEAEFQKLDVIRRTKNVEGSKREIITTREVLQAEQQIISYVREGRGTKKALGREDYQCARTWLNEQQQQAVKRVLTSRDAVTAIMGGAGTGKTSLMQEAVEAIQKSGKEVHTFTPSTGARDVLVEKGFPQAQTVEHLLRNKELQQSLKGQVLWVDEAGLLDVKAMQGIFQIAKDQQARVILSGDTRQHASPRRGAALQILEKEAGLNIARVETIQRQKGQYKQAVNLISQGHEFIPEFGKTGLLAGFDLLDQLGKIKEVSGTERYSHLARQYLDCQKQNKTSLIVSPTHAEAAAVTKEIRELLKSQGMLPQQEHTIKQLRSLNLTDAQKREASTYQYQAGLIVQFHQHIAGGIKKGDRYQVGQVTDRGVEITHQQTGQKRYLPSSQAKRFEVYQEQELKLSAGDKLRFSAGGTSLSDKKRIANGRLDELKGIDKQGNLILKSGMTISKDYGHLDLGYVVTSHASQGKDRQVVLASLGNVSQAAINAKQFYVTVSRGQDDVQIYVENKDQIRKAIARAGEELSATRLMQESVPTIREAEHEPHRGSIRRGLNHVRARFTDWWRSQKEQTQAVIHHLHEQTQEFERSISREISFEPGGN